MKPQKCKCGHDEHGKFCYVDVGNNKSRKSGTSEGYIRCSCEKFEVEEVDTLNEQIYKEEADSQDRTPAMPIGKNDGNKIGERPDTFQSLIAEIEKKELVGFTENGYLEGLKKAQKLVEDAIVKIEGACSSNEWVGVEMLKKELFG